LEKKKINTAPDIHKKVKEHNLNPAIRSKPVEIEDVIQNKPAYMIWCKLEENEWLNEKRFQMTSDGGEIDLAILHHILRQKISHLPEKEQVGIMSMKDNYTNARLKANV